MTIEIFDGKIKHLSLRSGYIPEIGPCRYLLTLTFAALTLFISGRVGVGHTKREWVRLLVTYFG
ncbi:MAG: hypothetical protein ABIX01_18200 [Chitinophagaceae bacterium]